MPWLIHSQKGSEWKDHKYVKREGTSGKLEDDGKYYYPDSYEGGRHLPKGDSQRSSKKGESNSNDNQEDWEKKVHGHLSKIIEDHPDLFKNGTDVAAGIMDPKNFDAVKNTLKAFGVKVDELSDDEIKAYRKKIADYYDKNYAPSEGKTASKSSKKKKKADTDEEKPTEEKKDDDSKSTKKKDEEKRYRKPNVSRAVYYGGKAAEIKHSGWIAHHGILGMRWGKRNGPPYPLGEGDHSASEKKAGWKKSLDGGSGSGNAGESNGQSQNNNQQPQQNQRKERHWKNALKEARREDVHKLSDQELSEYNKRLQMEKQFKDLTKEKETEGKKYVKGLGKKAFEAIVFATLIEVGRSYFKKKIFPGEKSGSSVGSKTAERVVGNAAKYAYRKAPRQVLALPMKHSAIGNAQYKTDELEHHGILGMHWGKRNGPPYPLGEGDHSASEKKAGWKKSLDGWRKSLDERRQKKVHEKDVKRKAKYYQKEMNKLQKKESDLFLAKDDYRQFYEKVNRSAGKNLAIDPESKKGKQLLQESGILKQKMSQIDTYYRENRKQINKLINKMKSDPDIVYRTSEMFTTRSVNPKLRKEMNNRFGGKKKYDYSSPTGGSRTVDGTRYIVKPVSTHGNKKKYNSPYYKQENRHRTYSTYTYYVNQ